MVVASFIGFLLVFTLIGLASIVKSKNSTDDYLVAGSSIPAWLTALSAVATNQSGFMFVGMIGYTYAVGMAAIWPMLGWMVGDLFVSFFVHKRLREKTSEHGLVTYSGALARWWGQNYKWVRLISALMIVAFLGAYAAAQLKAGSKALHVLFEWDYNTGAIIGAVIVLAYCFAGGIRASIWTDAAQSFVMLLAIGTMCFLAFGYTGGIEGYFPALDAISPTYLDFFPENMLFGPFLGAFVVAISWMSGGFGVIGQPHIMVRFMAMDNPKSMTRVRWYYYGWYTVFGFLVMGAGFATRLLLPEAGSFDEELALPMLAQEMLPEVLVGMVLAGLFAATMSTADSQILACSGAITHDLGFGENNYIVTKLATVFVTAVALLIALYGGENVFSLVLIAWSGLGATFAPLIFVYACGGRPSQLLAILMMVAGFAAMFAWGYTPYADDIYKIFPGLLAGFAVYLIGRPLEKTMSKAA